MMFVGSLTIFPDWKHKHTWKRCITESFSHCNNPTIANHVLTLRRNNAKCIPKKNKNTPFFPPNSAECSLSHLLMSPLIAPNDNSPVKPASNLENGDSCMESDIYMEYIKGISIEVLLSFHGIKEESAIKLAHKPKLTGIHGSYNDAIKIPLMS